MYGVATVDMAIVEAMTHNKKGIPSSINGIGKSHEKKEIQGAPHDIQNMEVGINPIKTGVNIRSMRQEKKKKVMDNHYVALYAKWQKNLMMQ